MNAKLCFWYGCSFTVILLGDTSTGYTCSQAASIPSIDKPGGAKLLKYAMSLTETAVDDDEDDEDDNDEDDDEFPGAVWDRADSRLAFQKKLANCA